VDRQYGALLLGIASLSVPGAALAADVRGNGGTTATMGDYLKGTVEKPKDSDWYRLTLKAGQDYAFRVNASGWISIRLHDSHGKAIARATAADSSFAR
jgi:hypothetical protein